MHNDLKRLLQPFIFFSNGRPFILGSSGHKQREDGACQNTGRKMAINKRINQLPSAGQSGHPPKKGQPNVPFRRVLIRRKMSGF
jgi:hypothetical protein